MAKGGNEGSRDNRPTPRRRQPAPYRPPQIRSDAGPWWEHQPPPRGTGPREKSYLDHLTEGVTDLLNTTTFVMALACFGVVIDNEFAKEMQGPTIVAAGPRVPQGRDELLKRLEALPGLLESPDLSQRAPAVARIVSPEMKPRQKCFEIRAILNRHLDDILTISSYLVSRSETIDNAKLRESFQKQLATVLGGMKPEEIAGRVDEVKSLMQQRMQGTYSYGVLQRCGVVSMTFFGGLISDSIRDYKDAVSPVAKAIVEGAKKGEPHAIAAAEALGRIEQDLVTGRR